MQVYLKKHGPDTATQTVKVEWSIVDLTVAIKFTLNKRSSRPWLSDNIFKSDWSKNWGLWNKDVVEAFLQLRKTPDDLSAPYLEIQVSPLNQPFALIITEPRKVFHAPKILDFTHGVHVDGRKWEAELKVTLPSEFSGNFLYGGFFACLDFGPREYFALEPNPEINPDFHRPDLFLALDQHE